MASAWGASWKTSWAAHWQARVKPPPVPPSVSTGGGGRGVFRRFGDVNQKVRGKTVREDLDRLFARLEYADEHEKTPPPAVETVEVVIEALAAAPAELAGILSKIDQIKEMLDKLGQVQAARTVARLAEEAREEEFVIALLLAR